MIDKDNPSTRTGIPSNKQTNPIRTPGGQPYSRLYAVPPFVFLSGQHEGSPPTFDEVSGLSQVREKSTVAALLDCFFVLIGV